MSSDQVKKLEKKDGKWGQPDIGINDEEGREEGEEMMKSGGDAAPALTWTRNSCRKSENACQVAPIFQSVALTNTPLARTGTHPPDLPPDPAHPARATPPSPDKPWPRQLFFWNMTLGLNIVVIIKDDNILFDCYSIYRDWRTVESGLVRCKSSRYSLWMEVRRLHNLNNFKNCLNDAVEDERHQRRQRHRCQMNEK